MPRKSWSFADDRRVMELAKASKSLEEAARIMKRTPDRIRRVSLRLGLSFKAIDKQKSALVTNGIVDHVALSVSPKTAPRGIKKRPA